jgi:hypothetical protein
MTIKFKNEAEGNELIAAMANKNSSVSIPAQEAFAAFIGPVLAEALLVQGTASLIYETIKFDEDESPELPVDPYFDAPQGFVSVWSQETAGGLPTNLAPATKTVKISTYDLDSAIVFEKRQLAKTKLNLVERGLERMANEVLIKQEYNAWSVILLALAQGVNQGVNNVIRSTTAGVVQMDDFNNLFMLADRLNAAFNGGTPQISKAGLTDLFLSVEAMGQLRSMSYQPQNTRAGSSTTNGSNYATSTALGLPDDIRAEMWRASGNPAFFDVELHKMWEFGVGNRPYNLLFDAFAGAKNFDVYGGVAGSAFDASTSQIMVGVNRNWRQAYRAVSLGQTGEFDVMVDDSFVRRQEKVGFYGKISEGRCIGSSREFSGLIY